MATALTRQYSAHRQIEGFPERVGPTFSKSQAMKFAELLALAATIAADLEDEVREQMQDDPDLEAFKWETVIVPKMEVTEILVTASLELKPRPKLAEAFGPEDTDGIDHA